MKRLAYLLTAVVFCVGFAVFSGGGESSAASPSSARELSGVWKGYAFSLSGEQSRVYAVFSKNDSGAVEVQLFSPANPWTSDREALCVLRGAECGRPVDFADLSARLPLEYRQSFFSNPGTAESGQIIKISPEGQRLQFTFRKGGYTVQQQEFTGYLETALN